MNARILIVEDDADINNLLAEILKREGCEVTQAFSGSEARLVFGRGFDLALLDLNLPAVPGETLIAEFRAQSGLPILVISARSRESAVETLGLGADDFISKPFNVEEVLARVGAQLRRYQGFSQKENERALSFGALRLDPETMEVRLKGEPVPLTAREFKILKLLMSYPKKVFTKDNLFSLVWEDAFLGDDNTVSVHISNLRAKLAKVDPDTEYVRTVWGIGYKLG